MKTSTRWFKITAACLLAAVTATLATAFEGKVDMKMTSSRKDENLVMTYFIKGTRMRTEFTPAPDKKGRSAGTFASIFNWDTKEITLLMEEQKMYMVQKLPEATHDGAQDKKPDAEFKPTGRKEKIAGIEAEEYVGESDGKRTELWVTKELGKFILANQQGGGGPMGGGKKPKASAWAKFAEQENLFALRTIQRAKEGAPEDFRLEVIKVEKQKLDEALFVPPKDYTKFELPAGLGDMMKGMIPGR